MRTVLSVSCQVGSGTVNNMNRSPRLIATTGLAVAAAALATGGLATASTPLDIEPIAASSTPLVETDLTRASEAALAEVGEGVVVSYSLERNGFELDVVRDDGTEVDVHLDEDFAVTRTVDDRDDDDDDDDDTWSAEEIAAAAEADLPGAWDAALAEADDTDAVVTDVDYDRDDGGYDVDVELSDGTTLEIDLDDDLTVVSTEIDD